MAQVIGHMLPDHVCHFAPITEYYGQTADEIYEAVGDRIMQEMDSTPNTLRRHGAFLVQISDSDPRIIGFPYRIANEVSVLDI